MNSKSNIQHKHDLYDYIQLIFRGTIPLFSGTVLLAGGIWLLTLPLPGWKLVLGLPAAQLGIIVLMFAFDDITKKQLHPENFKVVICPFCSHENLVHKEIKLTYCGKCQKRIVVPK
jgi:hypothetical protein